MYDVICNSYVYSKWEKIPELYIVGPPPQNVSRLPIFSLIFLHPPSGKYLHHNFVCTLLSDLFGVQARGGCSCAGPYAQVRTLIIHIIFQYFYC